MALLRKTTLPLDQLPSMTLTRQRWSKGGLLFAFGGLVMNAAFGLLVGFGAVHGQSVAAKLGWGAAWAFMVGVSVCNALSVLSVVPRWGTVTYTHGQLVPVTFRLDPDRPDGTYRAYLRGTRTPLTHTEDMAHIRLNGAQLTHSLRLGEHTVRVVDLMRYPDGVSFFNPPTGYSR